MTVPSTGKYDRKKIFTQVERARERSLTFPNCTETFPECKGRTEPCNTCPFKKGWKPKKKMEEKENGNNERI